MVPCHRMFGTASWDAARLTPAWILLLVVRQRSPIRPASGAAPKFVNVWEERPHEVSLGAQKNFGAFAQRIGQKWKDTPDDFNEAWYHEAVAKAIVFKATERVVTDQPLYESGYRANIVAYAIAKTAHDTREMGRAVDFDDIWRRQARPPRSGCSVWLPILWGGLQRNGRLPRQSRR